MEEELNNSAPELEEKFQTSLDATTENFDNDFEDVLNDNVDIDMDDKELFITVSKSISAVAPSKPSRALNTRATISSFFQQALLQHA